MSLFRYLSSFPPSSELEQTYNQVPFNTDFESVRRENLVSNKEINKL